MIEDPELRYIWSGQAIRERCQKVYQLSLQGKTCFDVHEEQLETLASYVINVIKDQYPDLKIPFHSRWSHFQSKRLADFKDRLKKLSKEEALMAKFDLVVPSVLLDAGAGDEWAYQDSLDAQKIGRSEGLAMASYDWFVDGGFSSDSNNLKTTAEALNSLRLKDFERAFQVSLNNPIFGGKGRVSLLNALGREMDKRHDVFLHNSELRVGGLAMFLVGQSKQGELSASVILESILEHLGGIWPSRIEYKGYSLGDVWSYSGFSGTFFDKLLPFHKLSQWLTYSLIEPLQDYGLKVTGLNELTGLAEYRNGGLLIDGGWLRLKSGRGEESFLPDAKVILEWRALTVVGLDQLANTIRKQLSLTDEELPLVKVLEGGTWWAGRRLARAMRPDGAPPLTLQSDGTVF